MNKQTANSNKRKKSAKVIIPGTIKALLILGALAAVVFAIMFVMNSGSKDSTGIINGVTIEAGDKITPSMFVFGESNSAEFYGEVDLDKMSVVPGIYDLKLLLGGQIYPVTLTVEDTVLPTGKIIPLIYKKGEAADPELMVYDIVDVTDVTVSFDHSPNVNVEGRQNVTIKLTDLGGNSRLINGTVYVTEDLRTPVWELGTDIPKISDTSFNVNSLIFTLFDIL